VELVRKGAADLAVVGVSATGPPSLPGLEATVVAEEPLRVVCAPDDPLATAGSVAIGDLRGQSLILAEPGTPLRESVASACAAAGFSPVPLFEVSDPWTVRFLTSAGLGASVVPRSWVELPGPPVGVAELRGHAPRHRVALLAPAADRSPAATLLHEHLARALRDGG
jgi:DNA-binding transcriptional LysR family regulator